MLSAALKWFRTCIGLNDEHHNRQLISQELFGPILDIVYQTMPRDNLLNSACLELFEFIKRENLKQLIIPLVENYREKLLGITYVNTFSALVIKYEQIQGGNPEDSFTTQGGDTPNRNLIAGGQPWQGLKDADQEEEKYFNQPSDEEGEDEGEASLPETVATKTLEGTAPLRPLVSYPEDEEEDAMELLAASPGTSTEKRAQSTDSTPSESIGSPPSSIPVKRGREEDEEEDDLEKLASGAPVKRHSSVSSIGSVRSDMSAANLDSPTGSQQPNGAPTPILRRKGSLRSKDGSPKAQKGIGGISISLSGNTKNEQGSG